MNNLNMKKRLTQLLAVGASLAALALVSGCNKQDKHAEDDGHDHAGHKHGKSEKAEKGTAPQPKN
jgi:hypothetical protein